LQEVLQIPVIGMESPRGIADPSLGAFAQILAQADCILLLGKRLDFTLKFGSAARAALFRNIGRFGPLRVPWLPMCHVFFFARERPTRIPVILCDGWTPAQVKAFRLMVNRSVTWADWDEELLAEEL